MENGRGGCEEGNWRKWGEGKEKKGGGGRRVMTGEEEKKKEGP